MNKRDVIVPESKIQAKGLKMYSKAGVEVIRLRQTSKAGDPDTLVSHPDHPNCFIEYKKSKGGRLDPLQRFRIAELRRKGFFAFASASPTLHECEKEIICHTQCDECKLKPCSIPPHLII